MGTLFTSIHYPKQFLLAPLNYNNFWLDSNRTVNKMVYHAVDNVELLLRRDKRRDHCTSGSTNFDDFAIGNHIANIGCRPPYFVKHTNYPVCSTKESMKSFAYLSYLKNNKTYKQPCLTMPKIDFTYTEDPSYKNEMYFGIGIAYPEHFKMISQYQVVDFHSLVGNIGGYIGLFLGSIATNIII